ncbi:5-bromo-4-chloroindolyl phosphate hydrolysis family protein [Bacillus massilinigeriensis]|uniref:5-bromo-4-chloroindolyl phosphate hydrolysis family protein n=1 Tax=Bacillus massilionigeriensis TaxID=1805475 RepID=UPI00096B669B|nr:5-bromo-4-chloroindolyl phosphate hydrolysis family protein [Bacillus massilionigeriensis]
MNPFLSFLVRTFFAIPTTIVVWLVSFFAFEQTFFLSTVFAILGGAIMYYSIKGISKRRFLKRHGLSRKEYMYIEKNLEEAKKKINRLNKALFSVRSIASLKQNIDIVRVSRRIYSITKKEPKRFYKAEKFYFTHLDSLVELSEKYAFLASQPKKNFELENSLRDTRLTIEDLTGSLEKDLYYILSNDIDELNFELDVAKKSIKTLNDIEDESRRIK